MNKTKERQWSMIRVSADTHKLIYKISHTLALQLEADRMSADDVLFYVLSDYIEDMA
jgi:hypothetical protein